MYSLGALIFMKHERSNFDTLSSLECLGSRIDKGGMRHAAGPAIEFRIIAFDQRDFIRSLAISIEPAMLRVRFDRQRLALAIRIDQSNGHQIFLGHGPRVRDAQRVFVDRLDGPPHVDDLVSRL